MIPMRPTYCGRYLVPDYAKEGVREAVEAEMRAYETAYHGENASSSGMIFELAKERTLKEGKCDNVASTG
jgi:hypothetical protein